MESLGVLDVFCTYSECATTSTSKFSKMSIFIIFSTFFPKMFEKMVKISTRSSSGWVLGHFCGKTVQISFQNFSAKLLGRTFLHPLLFLKIVKKWNLTFYLHRRGVLRDEFLRSEKFFHRKVWKILNFFHIYNVFISPIVQKIFTLLGKNLPH